jgi:hypothetical protein
MMKRCFPQQILTLHYLYSFSGPFKKGWLMCVLYSPKKLWNSTN